MIEFYRRSHHSEKYSVVYYGLEQFDMTSPSACTWIVPGTLFL